MRWFDPIEERWIDKREPAAAVEAAPAPEDTKARDARLAQQSNTWEAVVASATASCISSSREEHQDD